MKQEAHIANRGNGVKVKMHVANVVEGPDKDVVQASWCNHLM